MGGSVGEYWISYCHPTRFMGSPTGKLILVIECGVWVFRNFRFFLANVAEKLRGKRPLHILQMLQAKRAREGGTGPGKSAVYRLLAGESYPRAAPERVGGSISEGEAILIETC